MSGKLAIEARALTVRRGARVVCEQVDLAVERGGCVGVIGPNGSGKSTLLAGLRGLLPVEGRVRLNGIDPTLSQRRLVAQMVAVMPQRMEFGAPYAVEEMVLLGRAPHLRAWQSYRRADRTRVAELLERFDLTELRDVPVDALSGGERRKVFLARALAQETPIVFLDEPTAGLDPAAQQDLVRLIASLREEQRTLLVVLHDLRLAGELCGRLVGMRNGKVCFAGTPGETLSEASLEALYGIPWQRLAHDGHAPVFVPRATGAGEP